MTTVTIQLPDELARQAQQAGLLSPAIVQAWLQEKLRAKEQTRFFDLIEQMANDAEPAASPASLASEIHAARQQLKSLPE